MIENKLEGNRLVEQKYGIKMFYDSSLNSTINRLREKARAKMMSWSWKYTLLKILLKNANQSILGNILCLIQQKWHSFSA